MRRLAFLVPAALLLLGAAPANTDALRAALECRSGRAAMTQILATLPFDRQSEESEAGSQRLLRFYAVPSGLAVFGFTPTDLVSTRVTDAKGDKMLVVTAFVPGPYDAVEAATLAALNVRECPMRTSELGNCVVRSEVAQGWRTIVRLRTAPNKVTITCAYTRQE